MADTKDELIAEYRRVCDNLAKSHARLEVAYEALFDTASAYVAGYDKELEEMVKGGSFVSKLRQHNEAG